MCENLWKIKNIQIVVQLSPLNCAVSLFKCTCNSRANVTFLMIPLLFQ